MPQPFSICSDAICSPASRSMLFARRPLCASTTVRRTARRNRGAIPTLGLTLLVVVCLLVALVVALARIQSPSHRVIDRGDAVGSDSDVTTGRPDKEPGRTKSRNGHGLLLYCAAGMRGPVEQIVAAYRDEIGESIEVQFGGSNTLLSQLEVARLGDLYLAADVAYIDLAQEKGLAAEAMELAQIKPVLAVARGNPKQIAAAADMLRTDVSIAMANPDQAAVGRKTRTLLKRAGMWDEFESRVRDNGVFKPTVTEVANDVKLGIVDAAVVWDTTLANYPELEAVSIAELSAGRSAVVVSVLRSSDQPTAALRFARYLTAADRGLATFEKLGYEVTEGDEWSIRPEMTFFCGAVNRRAVETIVRRFSEREGVVVNTVYNGCGILTAQMRGVLSRHDATGFPDTYMACDRYYLDSVREWFQDDHDISDTEVVMVVAKGNPKQIESISDLAAADVRVTVGQPEQCTIGVLTRKVLKAAGVEDEVMSRVVQETTSSALLIPTVVTGAADVTFAYATDAKSESNRIDVVRLDFAEARAVQPFAVARSSRHKQLGRRLLSTIRASRSEFEEAGFHFRDQAEADGTP